MPKTIVIGTLAYNNLSLAVLNSIRSQKHDVEISVVTHSRNAGILQDIHAYQLGDAGGLRVLDYRRNRGVARSWNEILHRGVELDSWPVVLVNDDVVLAEGDLDRLVEASEAQSDKYIIHGFGHEDGEHRSLGYAFFAITKAGFEALGYFDENIFPAYFEDTDYRFRAELAGLQLGLCRDTDATHAKNGSVKNSPSLNAQNAQTSVLNRRYYVAKWGGKALEEVFRAPFDDESISLHISWDRRETPYGPAHDRVDKGIVNI